MNYARLHRFLEAWKLVVSHGDDSLLGPALPNYAANARRLLARDLTAPLKPRSKAGLLIEHIKTMMISGDEVSKLCRPAGGRLLKSAIAGGQRVSRAQWIQVLTQLEVGPKPSQMAAWLAGALCRRSEPSDARLRAIAFLLHRRAFGAHETDFLRGVAGSEFTRVYLQRQLPGNVDVLSRNERLRMGLNGLIEQTRHDAAARNTLQLLSQSAMAALQYQLPQARWSQRAHVLLRSIRGALERHHSSHKGASFASVIGATAPSIAADFVAEYVSAVVQYALTAHELVRRLPDAPFPPERVEQAVAREITDALSDAGVFAPQPLGEWWPARLDAVDALFAEGVVRTIGHFITRKLVPRVRNDLAQSIAGIASALSDALLTAGGGAPEFQLALTKAVGSLGVHRAAGELAANVIMPAVIANWDAACEHATFPDTAGVGVLRQAWSEVFTEVAKKGIIGQDVVRSCAWDTADSDFWREASRSVIRSLTESPSRWAVTYDVSPLDAEGAFWNVGNVVFYDPREYDYGDRVFRLIGEENALQPVARPHAGCCVLVRAATASQAVASGREAMSRALEALAFEIARASRPETLVASGGRSITVANLTTENWSGSWQSDTALTGFRAVHAVRDGIAAAAALPITRLSTTHKRPIEVQALRALHHLAEGDRISHPARRFLAYWIALEAALTETRKPADVAALAAGLHITWRNATGRTLSRAWRGRLRARVARRDPHFFRRDRLDRPAYIEMRFTETNWEWRISTGADPYQEWLEALDHPPAVEENRSAVGMDRVRNAVISEVNYRRRQTELRLRRLADLRNEIVHEGLAYRVDQRLFADAMALIARDVVGKIVNAITSSSPTNIEDVQRDLDAPWM